MNNCPKNHDCPPLMGDARFGTDYRPNCYVQHNLMVRSGAPNSHVLRQQMIKDGSNIMTQNMAQFKKQFSCPNCSYKLPDPNGHIPHWEQNSRSLGMKKEKEKHWWQKFF